MCLVAFQKISGKYFLVFGKEEGKHKSRKTQATTQKKIINDDKSSPTTVLSIAIDGAIAISPSSRDRDQWRDLATARSRSTLREIAPSIAISRRCNLYLREIAIDDMISRSVYRDLGSRSSDWSSRDRCGLELGVRRRSSD